MIFTKLRQYAWLVETKILNFYSKNVRFFRKLFSLLEAKLSEHFS